MNISHFFGTERVPSDEIGLVITVPTFKRPKQLIATLHSLTIQTFAKPFAIVIMDNDNSGQGAAAATHFLKSSTMSAQVILVHDRGNCHAYNAGWAYALAQYPNFEWLAVIDDDECASPQWLSELYETAQQTGADLVGGPQIAQFAPDAPHFARAHPVFKPPYRATGPVPILYSSGNVMIARHVLNQMPTPFLDPLFNFTGGGDSDFYRRCQDHNFRFAWCHKAIVREPVPPQRTSFRWINARSLRNGGLSSIIEKRRLERLKVRRLSGRLRTLTKTLMLLSLSPFRSILLAIRTKSIVAGLYPIQIAVGRVLEELGMINEQYRNPDSN